MRTGPTTSTALAYTQRWTIKYTVQSVLATRSDSVTSDMRRLRKTLTYLLTCAFFCTAVQTVDYK